MIVSDPFRYIQECVGTHSRLISSCHDGVAAVHYCLLHLLLQHLALLLREA